MTLKYRQYNICFAYSWLELHTFRRLISVILTLICLFLEIYFYEKYILTSALMHDYKAIECFFALMLLKG